MKLNTVFATPPLLVASTANSQTIAWSGGPVLQNVRVITVYWGAPDPQFGASMDRFYSQVTGTSYLGRLLEYSTSAFDPSGDEFRPWFGNRTEQVIGTGGGFWSTYSHSDEAWHIYTSYLGFDPYEVPDVCEGQSTRILTSPDPRDNYLISKVWSNILSKCVGLQPVGNFDEIVKDNAGDPHILGWTLDPENPNTQIQAHVYFDRPYPYGKGFVTTASLSRPDVNSGTGYSGSHGFDFVVPAEFRDGNAHAVYVYGIGVTAGNNTFLSSVPRVYNSSLTTQSPTEPVMIANAQAPGQCLDVTNASTNPGAAIQLYQCLGGDNQRFSYHADTQELRAYDNSYLCLDASGGAGNNGDRLIIWPCNGEANQKWNFNVANGEIRGVSGKCLDANAGTLANGTVVQIWSCNTGKNQSWFRK